MTPTIAITRDVSPDLAGCELSYVSRSPIDITLAAVQHRAYQGALSTLGCRVIALPAEAGLPDSVFVEDIAIVLDEIAIITRPGAESRRAERTSIAAALAHYRELRAIQAPGTLDGGDVLRVGRTLYVGQSRRSNASGIAQLRDLSAEFGYTVRAVPITGCLHLKSSVTQVSDDTLLLQPEWVDRAVFNAAPTTDFRIIEIDPDEPHAANAVKVGNGLVYPSCFPRTLQRLHDAGIHVITVDVSELQKAEGAVTCCSLVFRESAA